MRKRFWQLHSWLGLIFGLGLLLIGVTGSLLVFREELEIVVHPDVIRLDQPATNRLPFDRLLADANRQLPGYEITGWVVRPDPEKRLADVLWVVPHGSIEWQFATLDPSSGQLVASPRESHDAITGWLLDLHYTFFADHVGMIITAVFATGLCLLGVTGVWLYRDFWKNFFTLRWGRSARIFFSDVHKMVGISSVAFNVLLGFTGAYWNFTHVIGEELQNLPEPGPMERRLYSDTLSIDAIVADAARRLPGYRANYISLPWMEGVDATLYGSFPDAGPLRGPYGTHVAYDAQNGAHKSTFDLRTAGAWAQCVDAFTPLHFGTFGGLPVRILWCLGGLAPGVLAVSGFVIWRQRRKKVAVPALSREEVAAGR